MPQTLKTCRVCLESKPLSEFYVSKRNRDGYYNDCKSCRSAAQKAYRDRDPTKHRVTNAKWRAAHPAEMRDYSAKHRAKRDKQAVRRVQLKCRYGLTSEQHNDLLLKQQNCCAICGIALGFNLAVDHDHNSGHVRGLLCRQCNSGLGMFRDDPMLLQKAYIYLGTDVFLHDPFLERYTPYTPPVSPLELCA